MIKPAIKSSQDFQAAFRYGYQMRGRQLTSEKKKRGAGRRPRAQRGTPPHHYAHEAEINSRWHQRLIIPLDDEAKATTHTDWQTKATTENATNVTGVERSSLVSSEQAGQSSYATPG
ncbi:unnamed protein product [Schistocephalus solidus]|uniref:Transposase n=1 Tax=Schistocephalus solidus TaxID=70667 RepID=A0A183TQ00_SCHSO|nr:unnamed protein product [Schistocephalus solidus]